MAEDTQGDTVLQALFSEIMKVKKIYDGSNRVITQYEAYANAVNGQTCLRTDYTYNGATTNVDKMKESLDVWSSAYDM